MRGISALLLALPLLAGCTSNRKVTDTQPLERRLREYDTVLFQVHADPAGLQPYVEPFLDVFEQTLEKSRLRRRVRQGTQAPPGGVLLKLRIVEAKKGDKIRRQFNLFGDAEVTVDAELLDRSGRLSAFTVKGDSRKSTWRVGLNDTFFDSQVFKPFDDLSRMALAAAAGGVVDYLEDHD